MAEKVCAVVGVGPGMGLAIARRFGKHGFTLALVARDAQKLADYARDMNDGGVANVQGFAADVSDPQQIVSAFQQIADTIGAPSVLVYNTSAASGGVPSKLDVADLNRDFSINVVGALVSAQQVIRAMREQKAGTILFTGGGLALNPAAPYASLAVGKAGIRSLAYTLGSELEPDNIHVATVTILGTIARGTHYDPDIIAESYWQLHMQPRDGWQHEIVYK